MKIKYALPVGALLAGLFALAGCELTTPFPALNLYEIDPIIYTEYVQPILDTKCTRCHVGADAARGLRIDTWPNLIAGSDYGEAIIPFDGNNSLLIKLTSRLVGGPHPFELGADTLTTPEIDFLKRWIKGGAKFDDGSVPYGDATQLLYVPNQEDALISVIDIESQLVIRTVDLLSKQGGEFTPNARPHDIELDPDGSNWYVSLIGENKVIKMATRANNTYDLVGAADFQTPGMLGINYQKDQLYVGRSLSAVSPPLSIGLIKRSDMSIKQVSVLFPRPHALVVDPSGDYVHTGSLVDNRVMTIETDSQRVTFTLLNAPVNAVQHFAMSPDGTRLAASGQTNQLTLLDSSSPPGLARIGAIEVGNSPWHPVWTPDGKFVYVGNKDDNTVSVINATTFNVQQTITGNGLAEPHGSAISPDGRYVFISNRNTNGAYTPRYNLGNNQNTGTIVIINTGTNEIEKIIEVGRYPAGLAIVSP